MNAPPNAAGTLRQVIAAIDAAVRLEGGNRPPPVILSSLPDLPDATAPAFTFIQGPPGRNIALAIGLRAARPDTPLVLIMNADSVTLGTNHLIHAARRNFGMTLLLLRAELTQAHGAEIDRAGWDLPPQQRKLESPIRPLDWMSELGATLVARGDLNRAGELANLIHKALATPGFSVIGVTVDPALATGVLNESPWPEYLESYRHWAEPLRRLEELTEAKRSAPPASHAVPRFEVRIAGLGGQGIKLAGTVLAEAAVFREGLWATQRGDYGSATRGGPSSVDVVVGSDPITYPAADHPDALVLLTQNAADRYARNRKTGAYVIADPGDVSRMPPDVLPVPIAALAREHTGKPLAAGVVALGCVAALNDAVSVESLKQTLADNMPAKIVDINIAALAAGFAATRAALQEVSHV
jgi:2-oxoglutarate ferredoxin oxidoreductase subunit gamma